MQLGAFVLEKMGLNRYSPKKAIDAFYFRIELFRIEGLSVKTSVVRPAYCVIGGVNVHIAIGASANALAQCLGRDNFVENEDELLKEYKSPGPYCMILVGPSNVLQHHFEYCKEDTKEIIVYDELRTMSSVLDIVKKRIVPNILASLSITFNSGDHYVKFHPVTRVLYGETLDGKIIKPFSVTGSATLSVNRDMDESEIAETLVCTASYAVNINDKTADFFALALSETDALKRFLYFYMSIEIEIHRTFKKSDHKEHLARIITYPDIIKTNLERLFGEHRNTWTNPLERFVWCSICAWKGMEDADVDAFKRVKKTRDEISHGERSIPQPSIVKDVEILARKIHRYCLLS